MTATERAKDIGDRGALPSRFAWLLTAAKSARRAAGNDLASGDGERYDCREVAEYLEEKVEWFAKVYGEAAKSRARS